MSTPFTADTRMTRQMARGHKMRLGHDLAGYYIPTADAGIVQLVRTCCKETPSACAR